MGSIDNFWPKLITCEGCPSAITFTKVKDGYITDRVLVEIPSRNLHGEIVGKPWKTYSRWPAAELEPTCLQIAYPKV